MVELQTVLKGLAETMGCVQPQWFVTGRAVHGNPGSDGSMPLLACRNSKARRGNMRLDGLAM
jgi:hypothetical protein